MRNEARRFVDNFKSEYADTLCRVGEVMLSFTSGILTLVTFGTAYWLQVTSNSTNPKDPVVKLFHHGLWQNCTDSATSSCKALPLSGPSYLIAARFFMCLALVAGICAWVISIIGLLQHKALWLFLASGAYGLQTLCMLLGLASFAKGFSNDTSQLLFSSAWSYYVGWLATALGVGCALYFLVVAGYRYKNPSPTSYPGETRSYAPLAQFESTETASDDDDDDL